MVPCKKDVSELNGWDFSATKFCPEFKPTDMLKGNYYSKKFSWLRLAIHRCDTRDMVLKNGRMQNKTCASKAE